MENLSFGLLGPESMGSFHICQCLARLATLTQKSPLTICGRRRKTGGQFVEDVLRLAHGLLRLGLHKGDIVAISAFNSDSYLEWILAVAFIGCIIAPLNYRWSFEEARLALSMLRPVMLVTDIWHSAFSDDDSLPLRWHVLLGSRSSNFTEKSGTLTMEMLCEPTVDSQHLNYSCAPDNVVLICFTSGTTGRPKGVAINHASLIVQSLAKVAIVRYSEDDVYLHTAPLCHIGGLSSALAMLMVGACHVFIPKFEAKPALDAIEQHHVTSLITVPAIMIDLISSIRSKETWKGWYYVRKILNGGGGLSSDVIDAATKTFPMAKLYSAYGMTETCSSLTFLTLYYPTPEPSGISPKFIQRNQLFDPSLGVCVGKPAPHVEIKTDFDGFSEAGRILTRGPHVMLGYWSASPGKGSDVMKGNWFDTGEIGSVDDRGNVWLLGRANGRIKSGGENVYPEEVERILVQHPGINAAVVVGIPDARLGEKVVACIWLRDKWTWCDDSSVYSKEKEKLVLSGEILGSHCEDKNLSRFKIPKMFLPWKVWFPQTTSGKVRRDQVREAVMSHLLSLVSHL